MSDVIVTTKFIYDAIAAYDRFEQWDPEAAVDLLEAHSIMMAGLLIDAGVYRRGSVGVMAGGEVMHIAPPADRVPVLMADLFHWLAASEEHPLIASSAFHYEFEFIHPLCRRQRAAAVGKESGKVLTVACQKICSFMGGLVELRR